MAVYRSLRQHLVLSYPATARGTPMDLGDREVKCHPMVSTAWPFNRAWTEFTQHLMASELPRVYPDDINTKISWKVREFRVAFISRQSKKGTTSDNILNG